MLFSCLKVEVNCENGLVKMYRNDFVVENFSHYHVNFLFSFSQLFSSPRRLCIFSRLSYVELDLDVFAMRVEKGAFNRFSNIMGVTMLVKWK